MASDQNHCDKNLRLCNFVNDMGILLLMIMVSVSLGAIFLLFFFVGFKKGQFDDDESPAVRMLKEDKKTKDKIDS
ncbi:cbb3-type cytochrome oxidase assembly protein CcoS [Faecalibacter macacae]